MKAGKLTVYFCTALLMTMVLAVLSTAGAEPPVKGPDVKTGHITSDETWAVDYQVDNVVIDAGVTVTVNAGINLYMSTDTWFYVEGTLIFDGTAAEPVDLLASVNGFTWDRFQTNDTGTFDLQNFTITDSTTAHTSFIHRGQSSVFKNGIITGGYQGLYLWSNGGDLVENITIRNCVQDGIYINGNTQTTQIKDINISNVGRGAMMFESSQGCIVEGMVATSYGSYGIYTWESYGLHLSDIDVSSPGATGFSHVMGMGDYQVTDAIVREGIAGVFLNVPAGSSVNYTRLTTTSNVNIGVQTFSSSYGYGKFVDCDLQAAINPVKLISSGPPQRFDLLNTTWSWDKPFVTSGDVFLNISWYLDIQLVNALDDPINGTLMITPSGSAQEILTLLPEGKASKIKVMDRSIPDTITPGGPVEYHSYDLLFTYEENTKDKVLIEDVYFSNYTYLYQMMNLQPVVNLPETLETDEDIWGEIPLDDLIMDPEMGDLDIEAESDPNIHVNIIQGGSTLRFKNEIEHWFGAGWINLTITDGEIITNWNMTVTIHSVDDVPYFIEAPPELILEEDSWTYFNFTDKVEDVEGSPIEISFPQSDLYTLVYNETTMNLTITPAEDLNGLIEVEVNLSDGEVWTFEILVLNITPVNDAPQINAPDDWNITLKKGNQTTINLTSILFDVEGDNLTVSVDPTTHASVNGTIITISYEETFVGDEDQVTVTVSDGDLTDSSILTVNLIGGAIIDDDDDVNDTIGKVFIQVDEDSWNIEVEGDEGQTLYFVVEDEEGGRISFPMTYEDGKYTAEVKSDEAGEGNDFWISASEDGEPIENAPRGSLAPLQEEEEDEPFPIWVLILIIAVMIAIVIGIILAITKGKAEDHEE